MAADRALFASLEEQSGLPALRIYSWNEPAITCGYNQKTAKVPGLIGPVVRRPTGGGLVFHQPGELSFSIVTTLDSLPAGLIPAYQELARPVIAALRALGFAAELAPQSEEERGNPQFCFAYPAVYEIVVNKEKVVGAAQKRGRSALLQQAALSFEKLPGVSSAHFAAALQASFTGWLAERGERLVA
jgi:lipoate-protein ligase A